MYFITTKRMLEVCFSAHPNIQYRTFFINREWLFYSTFNFLTTLIFVSLFLKKCVRMNLI